MADYENSIFDNLPQRRRGAGVLDDERPSWREVLSMRNFDEGPLPPRPHVSGKGGPSINQTHAPPPGSPVNTVAPVASGTTTVGSTLSCTTGTWTNSPTSYAYQWLRNGANISGATSSTYLTVTADGGTSIRCTVIATNVHGSGTATSNALSMAPVLSAPANTVPPAVSGTATVGSTLSCTTGTWTNSPTSYAYQWLRGGVNISGATSSSYMTVAADGGTSVSCRVMATNAAGNTSVASNALAILGVPANTAAPVASGTLTVGSTLSCTTGTWTNSPTYTYQWQRGGANISGATSSTYVTVSADGGTSVGCLVTATNASGSASAASNTLAIAAAGHSAQALAYLARTVGGNEGGNGTNIANLIDGLVSDGVWAKLDALYVLAQQNATDSLLNLIGTSYTATVNAATFTAYRGYSAFGTNGVSTGFNPSTAPSPQFTQNSASVGFWANSISVSGGVDFGEFNTGGTNNTILAADYTGGYFIPRINWSSASSITTLLERVACMLGGSAIFHHQRVAYYNGGSLGTASDTASAVDNVIFTIGYSNVFGPTLNPISAAFIGASLGSAGQLALYNRLRTYLTAVGVP